MPLLFDICDCTINPGIILKGGYYVPGQRAETLSLL